MTALVSERIALVKRLIAWGVAIVVLYSATTAFVLFLSLSATYKQFQVIESKLSKSEVIAPGLLDALNQSAQSADQAAQDPTLAMTELLPWVGSDVHAARVLAHGIKQNTQVITPLFEQGNSLSIARGNMPNTLNVLSSSVDELLTSITSFNSELRTVDPKSLHFGIGPKIGKLKDYVSKAKVTISQGAPILKSAAILLNQPKSSTWFLATQNAAELRASGGLLGSYAVIEIDKGALKLLDYGSDRKLLSRGKLRVSYASGIDNVWGADFTDWRDLNVSSNIPDDGKIIADAWKQKYGQQLDGVMFFSQGTVAHLVSALGGITVASQDLTGSNTVDFLTKVIYAKYPNVDQKNKMVSEVMKTLFGKLSNEKINLKGLISGLANPSNQDSIFLWSQNDDIQSKIRKYKIDGGLDKTYGSSLIVSLNNGGGNKLDAYLKSAYFYSQGKCGLKTFDGLRARQSQVKIILTNEAPAKGLPVYVNPRLDLHTGQKHNPGSNREVVTIYAPVGSSDEKIFVDGAEEGATFSNYLNHPIYNLSVELNPGQTKTVTVDFIEPVTDSLGAAISQKPSLRSQRTLGGSMSKVVSGPYCQAG